MIGGLLRRPWATLVAALVAAFLVSMILGLSWRATRARPGANDPSESWSGSTGVTRLAAGRRPAVPDVAGTTLDGDHLALSELRGRIVVLNVWGSWCVPCRAEAADLAEVSSETSGKGVRFIGVDVRDSPAAARAFVRRYEISYPSWDDQHAKLLAHFAGLIPISAVPSTVILDQNGTVAARIVGRVRASTLRALIADLTKADDANPEAGIPR